MPVSVSCSGCGKQLNVKDEYLGKKLKCPQCGATFTATASVRPGKAANQKMPGLHISPGIIVLIAVVIAIPSVLAFWKYGPGKVADEWQTNLRDSEDNVMGVVDRGLLAYFKTQGFDMTELHTPPRALSVTFMFGPMHVTMPQSVGFVGVSTLGAFSGNYHPTSGEVEVDVEVNGLAVPATAMLIRRGTKTTHITGRERNSVLTVEVDGHPGG